MGNKNLKAIGGVGTIIGVGVTIYGKMKYDSANAQYKAASYFGENKTSDIWFGRLSDYKIFILVGAIVALISIIILLSGFLGSGSKENNEPIETKPTNSALQKLSELQKMKENALITKEEFEEKRKKILDSM